MIFTDTHAHLSLISEELGEEALGSLLGVYAEAHAMAVAAGHQDPIIVDPGVEPQDLPARLELVGGNLPSFLRFAGGVWPSAENLASPVSSLDCLSASIAEMSRRGIRVAAIGEGGLDYHHMDGSKDLQAELFEGQIALASSLGLPLIVHSRDAAVDTLSLIAKAGISTPVIIHCFSYGSAELVGFLNLGCWISFAGNLTYKKSGALREACAMVPDDRFLLETDAPYMNPMPHRGTSATPLDVERTYATAAELRGVGIPELAETVTANAHFLFG